MPILTPTTAYEIAQAFPGATTLLQDDGADHLQYAYRIQFPGVPSREIAITRMPTQEGVTVYINKQACGGDKLELLEVRKQFQGARGLEEYPRGYVGKTGDKGISAGAGSCPSLLPANNDVLRVSCSDADGFTKLVSWYSGVAIPATPELAAKPEAAPVSDMQSDEDGIDLFALHAELQKSGYKGRIWPPLGPDDPSEQELIEAAETLLSKERTLRLAIAAKVPTTRLVTTAVFDRNPDVIAEVLYRAQGVCQRCNGPAPFVRRSDGTPYLEVHHVVQLAYGGEDTVANAVALCPNCHRYHHNG